MEIENVENESKELYLIPIKDEDIWPGQIFYHYKNLKPYVILDSCKIQDNGVWIEALIYTNLVLYKQAENKLEVEKFVRTIQEFKTKFKKLGGFE